MPASPSWTMTLARWPGKVQHMTKALQGEMIMKALKIEPGNGQIRIDEYLGKEESLPMNQMMTD